MPLREVMRRFSRPFGYTWLRSRQGLGLGSWELGKDKPGRSPTPNSQVLTPVYRYELVQDLRSQLLEEELRNRDRNTALLALEREIQRYRPYLDLDPDEALAQSRTTPPEEKKLLERLATNGWGQIQMYFRLSAQPPALQMLPPPARSWPATRSFNGASPSCRTPGVRCRVSVRRRPTRASRLIRRTVVSDHPRLTPRGSSPPPTCWSRSTTPPGC